MTQLRQSPNPQLTFIQNLIRNPVIVKELRSRMRGRRAFVVLTVYLAGMSAMILLVYLAYVTASGNSFGPSNRQAGKALFAAIVGVQALLVIFIAPTFTSGTIVGEKERRTYDLLRTTLLSGRALVNGKLFSALSYIFLLILVSIPLQSIAFLLGGVSLTELFLSQLLIIISAVTYALIGLYFSSFLRSTLAASVTTFATALTLSFGPPILVAIAMSLLGSIFFGPRTPVWPFQAALIYAGLFLAATNLPATLVVSDIFLVEQDALFVYTDFVDGHTLYIFSPWFLYATLYIILALLLYWACIRHVRRVAKE